MTTNGAKIGMIIGKYALVSFVAVAIPGSFTDLRWWLLMVLFASLLVWHDEVISN